MTPAAQAALPVAAALGWALCLVAVTWSLRAAWAEPVAGSPGWKWWTLAAAVLLCFRWPLLGVPHQFNPDESQLIAGAITLRHDPVFWRAVDGTTAGPLDFYPLLPAAWVEGMASYAVARLIGLAMIFGAVVFAGEALAILAGAALARMAVLPAVAAIAFTTYPDFVHYSSELMPVLLLAAAGWLVVRSGAAPSTGRLWLIALVLGAVGWAKLQAAPIAAGLWLIVAARNCWAGRSRALFPLAAGALLPTLAWLGLAALTGQMENLIVPYLLNNLAYVGAPVLSWTNVASELWQNALLDGFLGLWLAGAAVFLVLTGLRYAHAASAGQRAAVVTALVILAMAIFSALAPRRASGHYLLLLPLPLLWLSGTLLALGWPREGTPAAARGRLRLAGIFLVCALVPQLAWRVIGADPFAFINAQGPNPARRELTTLVRTYAARNEPLAVWGWRSSLYVEAGRRQATRQAHSVAQINPGPLQSYFLRRYLEDFQAANPPVFADAVGPGNFAFRNRDRAHEAFPPLAAWVRTRYTQVADLDGTRLFVRNDRLAATAAAPVPARP